MCVGVEWRRRRMNRPWFPTASWKSLLKLAFAVFTEDLTFDAKGSRSIVTLSPFRYAAAPSITRKRVGNLFPLCVTHAASFLSGMNLPFLVSTR